MSLLEQDHQKEAGVWERYEVYKNTAMYKNATQLWYKMIYENVMRSTSSFIDVIPFSAYPSSTFSSFAMWAPPPPPSKTRLLVVRMDGWLPVTNDTSTMTIWVKGYQLSTIRQRRPEWRVVSHQQYVCENDLYGCLLNQRLKKLYGQRPNLCGQWPL